MEYLPRPEDLLPLLPGALTAAILLLVAGALERRRPRVTSYFLAGLALALGHLGTWMMSHESLPWPPNASSARMLYAIPAVSILAASVAGRPRSVTLPVHGVTIAGLVWYLLYPLMRLSADDSSQVGFIAVLSVIGGTLVFWVLLDLLTTRIQGGAVPIALSLAMATAGQAFLVFGSASLGQLFGTCALALGVYAVLAAVFSMPALPRPAIAGVVAVAAGVGFDGWYFMMDPVPPAPLAMIAAAPLLTSIALVPKVRAMRPASRFAILTVLLLVCLSIAMALVVKDMPPPDPDSYYGK